MDLLKTVTAIAWLFSTARAQDYETLAATREGIVQFYPSNPSAPQIHATNCKSITQCLIDYPQQLDSSDPDGFDIGLIINPRHQTRPGDHTCSSGRCFVVNPSHLCNAANPHCVPIHNLRQPLTPCDPSNPFCTPGGFILDIDTPCHPLDTFCGSGGVLVNPRPCQRSKTCPSGSFIPNWIDVDLSGGFNVTGPLLPTSYLPLLPEGPRESGYLIDPNLICPSSIPECRGGLWLIIRVDRECTVGQPGCVGVSQIRNPRHPVLPTTLCPSGGCMVIPIDTSCHPNNFECTGIAVDPVPCLIGTRDCHAGVRQPPPFHRCRVGTPGCFHGILLLPPPSLPPTDPPPPDRPSILVPDYEGSIRCSYVEINHLKPSRPQTPAFTPDPKPHPPAEDIDFGRVGKIPPPPPPQAPSQPPIVHLEPEPPQKPEVVPQPPAEEEPKPPQQSTPPVERQPPAQSSQPAPPPPPPAAKEPEPPSQPATPPPAAPESKFPCSKSDDDPCRGKIIRNWVYGANYWDWSGAHAKPNMPKHTTLGDKNFPQDTILEVVDSWFNNAHYTIWIDGKEAGQSNEKELMNNKVSCSGGDDCVKKGFSHAWIFIPKGQHTVEVGQTDGYVNGDADRPYTYGFTQFITRLHAACDSANCP